MDLEKAVVIHRRTSLEELVRRHATLSQARFYIESRGESFATYDAADKAYKAGLQTTLKGIPRRMRIEQVEKELLGTYQFGDKDLVVVVGDDGLLVNAAKYVQEQPVILVNADPERFDGVLASCDPEQFAALAKAYVSEPWMPEYLTMAEARLEDGQVLYALNDLFIGKRGHSSARYTIRHKGASEAQSSSGIIVSTGTGSTGWLTSVLTGARRIANLMDEISEEDTETVDFPRDADYLTFVVREPFPSKVTSTSIIYGEATARQPLEIISQMPENGVIFSDGIEADYLEFTAGKKVQIRLAERKVHLVTNERESPGRKQQISNPLTPEEIRVLESGGVDFTQTDEAASRDS